MQFLYCVNLSHSKMLFYCFSIGDSFFPISFSVLLSSSYEQENSFWDGLLDVGLQSVPRTV